jgi:4-hydroxy-L-threonine phosphate dehydrogenase PdxA
MDAKPIIAIPVGDPAGIGPEISLKAVLSPEVRAIARPVLVGDPGVIERHARVCRLPADFLLLEGLNGAAWPENSLPLLAVRSNEPTDFSLGSASAASGRLSLAAARTAIHAALDHQVHAVVAAPQNQTSIALAGIEFDGYPSFVAREIGLAPHDVYLMLCFEDVKIVHCTLHVSVAQAIALITRERVTHVIRVTDRTLRRLGIDAPKIHVSGLNPHAGEGGLFGREEIEIIEPAVNTTAAEGINVSGPFGADTMFHKSDVDAFIVMLHDQGHITAKLLARRATAGLAIGSPILFSSVAHGSGHDIVGRGIADPTAMIEAILRLARSAGTVGRDPKPTKL